MAAALQTLASLGLRGNSGASLRFGLSRSRRQNQLASFAMLVHRLFNYDVGTCSGE